MFILNPKASGFNKFDYKKQIEKYLKEKKHKFWLWNKNDNLP